VHVLETIPVNLLTTFWQNLRIMLHYRSVLAQALWCALSAKPLLTRKIVHIATSSVHIIWDDSGGDTFCRMWSALCHARNRTVSRDRVKNISSK